MKLKQLIIFSLLILRNISGNAQPSVDSLAFKHELSIRSDNDAYLGFGQDKYYTNGLFLTFRKAMNQLRVKPKVNKRLWEVELGQEIYNPQSGYIQNTVYIDRPFAGYLYVGGRLVWLYNSEDVLKTTLKVGAIGPASLAKEAQSFLHNTFGFYQVKGWDYQINNEFAVDASIEYNHFIFRSKKQTFDLTLASYANVGDTFIGVGGGFLIRMGTINPFFQSLSARSRISHSAVPEQAVIKREFFFYAKPMIHYRAYDATVEGGLLIKNKGPFVFDIKSIVMSHEFGLAYAKNRWTAMFSVILKSREIKSIAKPDQYGSIGIAYQFK